MGETNNQNKLGKKTGAYLETRRCKDEHDDEDNHMKQIDKAWQWIYQKYMQCHLKNFVMKFCNYAKFLISLMITKVS